MIKTPYEQLLIFLSFINIFSEATVLLMFFKIGAFKNFAILMLTH